MRPIDWRLCTIAILLLVPACKDMPQARTESEITSIATDAATDVTEPKFTEIDGRLDHLEAKANELEQEKAELAGQVADLEKKNADLESEVDSIRAKVGY